MERTIEHRRSVAEIERYFGEGLTWQPYLPKRTAFQDAARHGVPVQCVGTAAGRDVAAAATSLSVRVTRSHAIG